MRFIFKTDYSQDIKLAKHGGQVFWYGALLILLLAVPWLFAEYWLAQLTLVLIYSIVGLGLMLLAGFTGLFSLGHAAFLGVGAYTQAVLTNMGWPFPLALLMAGLISAVVGVVVGLPALRVRGIYLGIATLSFGFIVEESAGGPGPIPSSFAGRLPDHPPFRRVEKGDSSQPFSFAPMVHACTHLGAVFFVGHVFTPQSLFSMLAWSGKTPKGEKLVCPDN